MIYLMKNCTTIVLRTYVLAILFALFVCCRAEGQELFSPDKTLEVLTFVKKWLPQDPIILEAGSYNGNDTVLMAQQWPESKIFTFEPIIQLFLQTKQNTSTYPNVKCFQKALSDKSETTLFYVSEINGNISASSSLLPPKEHLDFYPYILFPSSIEIEAVSLDEWAKTQNVDHIDFLWLDMQGYELPMLKKSQLAQAATAIYIEVEFVEAYEGQFLYEDVYSWMLSQGFHLVATDFRENQREEQLKSKRFWGNCLFVKEDKL